MAKERFLIVAVREMDDCFSRFSETANRANLDAGTADPSDPYSWIEATYSIQLRRYREATHLCSFTPSAYYVFLQNQFVGVPNAAWEADGDPDGLEYECGGRHADYGMYYDEYPKEFVCSSFIVDTVKYLGLRKPRASRTLSRRSDKESERLEVYHAAIWKQAEETASESGNNGGFWCDGLDVSAFRQRERMKATKHLTGNSTATAAL